MTFLLIDTATERSCIGIFRESHGVFEKQLPGAFLQSKELFPLLNALCKECECMPHDFKAVVVGVGPGSYTGIRVGVSAAKAISYALGIPLIGVCTLKGFVPEKNGMFLALLDAKIGGIYCLEGESHDGVCTYGTVELLSLEACFQKMDKVSYIVTPSWEPIAKRIKEKPPIRAEVIERGLFLLSFVHEACVLYEQKEYSLDGYLDIIYLRKTQAEIERE